MADTVVERLTGTDRAGDVDVEVGVVIPVDALLDPDSGETVLGHGPAPAGITRDILATTDGQRRLRRLFAHPTTGAVIDADPTRRFFDRVLAKLIRIRNGDRGERTYYLPP